MKTFALLMIMLVAVPVAASETPEEIRAGLEMQLQAARATNIPCTILALAFIDKAANTYNEDESLGYFMISVLLFSAMDQTQNIERLQNKLDALDIQLRVGQGRVTMAWTRRW